MGREETDPGAQTMAQTGEGSRGIRSAKATGDIVPGITTEPEATGIELYEQIAVLRGEIVWLKKKLAESVKLNDEDRAIWVSIASRTAANMFDPNTFHHPSRRRVLEIIKKSWTKEGRIEMEPIFQKWLDHHGISIDILESLSRNIKISSEKKRNIEKAFAVLKEVWTR